MMPDRRRVAAGPADRNNSSSVHQSIIHTAEAKAVSAALESLLNSGTKLWLDSIDPELVRVNREAGPITGSALHIYSLASCLNT